MTGIRPASVTAGPLFQSSEPGLLIMAGTLYIHNMNAETAKQWIGILNNITEEKETN